jgi:topoisomerase-4 subunit A
VTDPATDRVVTITNEGRMLVFPVAELPVLNRGKGNKIISIPAKRVISREEYIVAMACVPEGGKLTAFSGKRFITLKGSDLDHYQGERGRRGNKLPRGFQRVDTISVEPA